jgi:hypothetical protein
MHTDAMSSISDANRSRGSALPYRRRTGRSASASRAALCGDYEIAPRMNDDFVR